MAKSVQSRGIPTELSLEQFRQFVLPHLTVGSRGPAPKLSLHALFNYILKLLYIGCQWKELPIARDARELPEIHYTRICGAFRRWHADGCFNIIFTVVVLRLHQTNLLDVTIIHGDGTTTAAKKGSDNIAASCSNRHHHNVAMTIQSLYCTGLGFFNRGQQWPSRMSSVHYGTSARNWLER
jgi:hypothetical protein